jgi:hypothetical protein
MGCSTSKTVNDGKESRRYPEIYKEKYGERPMKEVLKDLQRQYDDANEKCTRLSHTAWSAIQAIEKAKQEEYEQQTGVKTVLDHLISEGETYLCLPENRRLIVEFVYSDKVRLRGGKAVIHREHILTGWKTPVREKSPEEKRLDDLMSVLWQEICEMEIWA